MLLRKLYVRIWLAVVLAVAVLTMLVGWAWRMTSEAPLREVVVRNAVGTVIGNGELRSPRYGGNNRAEPGEAKTDDGRAAPASDEGHENTPRSRYGNGPEFTVHMLDGQTLHLHLPRPASNWRAPFGFFWTLGLVAVAVALALFPIMRRLTRRLETLHRSVERWGNGDLSVRTPQAGNDELGFLSRGFNHAADQIETLVRGREALLTAQKSLLANASHELRSPLARIRMGLEFMRESSATPVHAEILRNITELDQLIEEILLSSRLDAQEANLGTIESVDLVGLCAEACAHAGASLNVHGPAVVVPGVAKLLRRVVRNLLENANRYATGDVELDIHRDAEFAVLRVSDRGPGVPENLQHRIFEPFYRLPGASEREGGVGLGLALVRSIVVRHGGSVRCSNRPEGGAIFEVRLPLAP